MLIKSPKNFWTAIIYLALGLATICVARGYPFGVVGRMGPGYFPIVLGALLSLVGIISLLRSFRVIGAPIEPFSITRLLLITGSVILFGVLARGAGLIPALALLIILSAKASIKFRWGAALALAVGLTAFSALLFVKALGVPLPLIGSWFGA